MRTCASKRLVVIIGTVILLLGLAPSAFAASPAAAEQAKIYLIAVGDNGQTGERIGCGDSLIPVTRDITAGPTTPEKIAATLTLLFSLHDRDYGQSGLVNALYASHLQVKGVEIQNGKAVVYLTGTMSLAGVCDDPRVEAQIAATAKQFAGVSGVLLFLNGGPLVSEVGGIDFPQTGQSVDAPFFPYWQDQGGLPIFGYPLSDQFAEGGYRVQYFERQRLEAHPENAAPYNVLFGLVGLQSAERRGLLKTPPFAKALSSGNVGCEYFPATGHNLCDTFRTYWHGHGLDFGEPGFSARESLALFGFPISEPFEEKLENGQTYTVQYFERVRMEFHPENPAPYRVLLGRLTADLVPAGHR